jgi:hypothetical protein
MADPVRAQPQLNVAEIQRRYDEGVAFQRAGQYVDAIRMYAGAVIAGKANPENDYFVRNDVARRAGQNLGGLAYDYAAKLHEQFQSATTEADRRKFAGQAMTMFNGAATGYDAARTDNQGRPNASIESHVYRASTGLGRVNLATTTGYFQGGIGVGLNGGQLNVRAPQLLELGFVRGALTAAKAHSPTDPDDVKAAQRIPALVRGERDQRIQTLETLTAGAYAALADSTMGMAPLGLSSGEFAAMGDVTSFASQIRNAAAAGNARPLLANRQQWLQAWTQYFEGQVAAPDLQDTASRGLVGEARTRLQTLRSRLPGA